MRFAQNDAKKENKGVFAAVLTMLVSGLTVLCFDQILGLEFDVLMLLPAAAACAAAVLFGKRQKAAAAAALLAAAVCAALLAFAPLANEGLKQLCVRCFEASERVNRYIYIRPDVSSAAGAAAAASLRAARLLLSTLSATAALAGACARRPTAAVTYAVFIAAFEIYFGIVPQSSLLNAALFSVLLLAAVSDRTIKGSCVPVLLIAAVFALTASAAPGVSERVELSSELARDRISAYFSASYEQLQAASEARSTRHESRYAEVRSDEPLDDPSLTQMRRNEIEREDISLPEPSRRASVLLICLEILALFTVPFVPFYLLEKRRKKLEALKAEFFSEDGSAAVRAMFSHALDCMTASGIKPGNRDNIQLSEDVGEMFSPAYAEAFDKAAEYWQEAEYSSHQTDDEKRSSMLDFVRETEKCSLEHAGRAARFRLRYIDCLITGV